MSAALEKNKVNEKLGDPPSPFPDRMLKVPVPVGAVLDVQEMRDEQPYKQFGIKTMLQGLVTRNHEQVEGTVLYFNNDTFRVDVDRRDLSAEDINRIGSLSVELEQLAVVIQFLPKQLEETEEMIREFNAFAARFKDTSKALAFNPETTVAELGILVSKMRISLVEQRERWYRTIDELSSLGVVLTWDQNGGVNIPIWETAHRPASEPTAA